MVTAEEYEKQYYEKRYFRCGTFSYWAAFWFGYLEAKAIIPNQYFPQKKTIHNRSKESEPLKAMFDFLVRGSESDILRAWNDNEGIKVILNVFQDQTGIDPAEVHMGSSYAAAATEILRYNVSHNLAEKSQDLSLVIAVRGEGEYQCACLYYQYLARESIVELDCGDLHVKYALFQRAEKMCRNSAVSLDELTQYKMKCRCAKVIDEEVFQLAVSETDRFSYYDFTPVMQMIYSCKYQCLRKTTVCTRCMHKGAESIELNCPKSCFLCRKCTAKHYFSGAYAWCPKCAAPLHPDVIQELEKVANAMICLPFLQKKCYLCYESNEVILNSLHSRPSNECYLCDRCLQEEIITGLDLCRLCGCEMQLPQKKIVSLRRDKMLKSARQRMSGDANQEKGSILASSSKPVLEESKNTGHFHPCSTAPPAANECKRNKDIGRQDMDSEEGRCSICDSIFDSSHANTSNCETHGAICFYCVFHEKGIWRCNACQKKCEVSKSFGIHRSEINLACCSPSNPAKQLKRLKCGHYAHKNADDCKRPASLECRLCAGVDSSKG